MTTPPVLMFADVWDMVAALEVIAAFCGLGTGVFWWLAVQEECGERRAYLFDLYRGFAISALAWCCSSASMALEPYIWITIVPLPMRSYAVFSGWLLLAAGWMLGIFFFAAFRVQEHVGRHVWQRPRRRRIA